MHGTGHEQRCTAPKGRGGRRTAPGSERLAHGAGERGRRTAPNDDGEAHDARESERRMAPKQQIGHVATEEDGGGHGGGDEHGDGEEATEAEQRGGEEAATKARRRRRSRRRRRRWSGRRGRKTESTTGAEGQPRETSPETSGASVGRLSSECAKVSSDLPWYRSGLCQTSSLFPCHDGARPVKTEGVPPHGGGEVG